MRTIPAAMRTKLLERFHAGLGGEPSIRLVATQTSTNTLLSEPIHRNAAAAFGDVAIRQMIDDADPALAYAVCLDSGVAKIYKRNFPADFEEPWEYLWTLGAASDAAMEFDGIWELDGESQSWLLRTEQYPYLFWSDGNGNLWCQYWDRTSTRVQLSSGVSQLSAVKGWQNSLAAELDQGLVIGYIKSGSVYYRNYCTQEGGEKAWESEKQVSSLGSSNSTLALIRTNDFRIGFLTQSGDDIQLALTHRNYAGMSVRAETVHVNGVASFGFPVVVRKYGNHTETMTAAVRNNYFNFDSASSPAAEIAVDHVERQNRDETFYSYGVKIYPNKVLSGVLPAWFASLCTATATNSGGTATSVAVSDVSYDAVDGCFTMSFAEDVKRTLALSVVLPVCTDLSYARVGSQRWPFKGLTGSFVSEAIIKNGYDNETMTAAAAAAMTFPAVVRYDGFDGCSMTAEITAGFVLSPSSILPI